MESLVPSESSQAVVALGSRTTMLHPEMKRHRAWWREILSAEVAKKLAERAFSTVAVKVCCLSSLYCCLVRVQQ